MKKQVPYVTSTGIQIGIGYIQRPPKPMPIDDKDMLYLQEALLATPEYIRSKHIYNATIALSTLGALFITFAIFLFS
jgi:hypothetical protein